MKRHTLIVLCLLTALSASAQDNLFGSEATPEPRKGLILAGNASLDFPAADMAKRFGISYRLGPALLYKTKSNWLFGAKFDFILGNAIKEDSIMSNIVDKYQANNKGLYEFINQDGQRIGVPVYERGYAVGISAGKILNWQPLHPDCGLQLLTTVGFIQHKLNIFNRDKDVPQLRNGLIKGYDRLTNGAFVEQYAGYTYFSNNKLINFHIGLDVLVGFTQGRRDYLYDRMTPDDKQRLDILFGFRGGWYIPLFKRKSEDLLFE
jgi:hypothetical protein